MCLLIFLIHLFDVQSFLDAAAGAMTNHEPCKAGAIDEDNPLPELFGGLTC
jgi:hypothetical protein